MLAALALDDLEQQGWFLTRSEVGVGAMNAPQRPLDVLPDARPRARRLCAG